MKNTLMTPGPAVLTLLLAAIPTLALAHVSVRPRESKPDTQERYTVRVPTEKQVSTTSVDLEIPAGVTVVDVPEASGVTQTLKREGNRVVTITWTREIKPRESAEFVFVAHNPASGSQVTWRAHQRYADGTVSDWTPATTLTMNPSTAPGQPSGGGAGESAAIIAWLGQYDAAFVAKDLDKLATFYHPDVTIYEGGGINRGWIDYRDRHLGPELKGFENLQFSHSNIVVRPLGPDAAYVTAEYSIKAKMPTRDVDSGGLATHVLVRQDGAWKIRHSHTSSRPRRPAG